MMNPRWIGVVMGIALAGATLAFNVRRCDLALLDETRAVADLVGRRDEPAPSAAPTTTASARAPEARSAPLPLPSPPDVSGAASAPVAALVASAPPPPPPAWRATQTTGALVAASPDADARSYAGDARDAGSAADALPLQLDAADARDEEETYGVPEASSDADVHPIAKDF